MKKYISDIKFNMYIITNLIPSSFLIYYSLNGYLLTFIMSDISGITIFMSLLMLIYIFLHGIQFKLENKLLNKICITIGNIIPYMGLVGTIIGFRYSIHGLAGTTLTATNIQSVMIPLVGGVEIALITTLVGSIFGIWIYILRQLLSYKR